MIGTGIKLIEYLYQQPKDKVWELTEKKKKRSLDANAYFHKLCDLLRQKLGISMARCKNHLIADYGQIQYLPDGSQMIYKTNAPEDWMMELETLHTKMVKAAEENGKEVYFYRVYRGSHTYNSAEMSTLINGLVEECKQVGIETATSAEIERMNHLWKEKHG